MNLRSRNLYKGFYSDLNKGFPKIPLIKKDSLAKKISKLCFKKDFEALNYLILKSLISSNRRSPLISGKMEINKGFQSYLGNKYNIFNKYKNASDILKDYSFLIERYYNQTDYCTIYENLLEIKVGNPRKLNFYSDEKMEIKQIFFKTILYYKFTIDNRKINI